ncbi:MAG: glycosyltransferase family protein [Cecembia sp.]
MKFLFIVQGEGRGHMTQAISMSQYLDKSGHDVVAVCIGKSSRRKIPEFVFSSFPCPVLTFDSPNFVTDQKGKEIRLFQTITQNLAKTVVFGQSLKTIDHLVKKHQPDVILNFYDLLGGIYNLLYRPKSKFWVIGHQYLIGHQDFPFAKGQALQKLLFIWNTKLTALGAEKELALSLRPMEAPKRKKLKVLPPLLRKAIKSLHPTSGNYFLSYVVNPGYGEEIIAFAKAHPQIQIVAFWDKKDAPEIFSPTPNLTFHQVNDSLFLEKMAGCKGLLCTAGFESICEAFYLGKPVMVVPVKGQYEQACNALDTEISGAGMQYYQFDFLVFEKFIQSHQPTNQRASIWTDSFFKLFKDILPKEKKTERHQPSLLQA